MHRTKIHLAQIGRGHTARKPEFDFEPGVETRGHCLTIYL
jgi:hypothetical protein